MFQVLFKLVSWAFPDFKFSWLVKETKRNIPIELDFLQEGHNAEKVGKMFGHLPWLKVWHLTKSDLIIYKSQS
jgi:aarF domain-containing kinase